MATQLQQALRSLCYNSDWKYAVFWKFKHQSRMMLTWEDAYYDNNHEQQNLSEGMCSSGTGNALSDWHAHDPLGLAVAKMTYHVYSLGEGVVGQVAVTGKHMWILADNHITDYNSTIEHCDGWQAQFSAGIKTVVVVPISPYGVIQLGSLNKVSEDLKLVNHMRQLFLVLQDSSVESISIMASYITRSSLSLSQIGSVNKDKIFSGSSTFNSTQKLVDHSYAISVPANSSPDADATISKQEELGPSTTNCEETCSIAEQHKKVEDKSSVFWSQVGDDCDFGHLRNDSDDVMFPVHEFGVDIPLTPSDLLDSRTCNVSSGFLQMPESLDVQIDMDFGQDLESNTEFKSKNTLNNNSFSNYSGCELFEALGPAFQREHTNYDWDANKIGNEIPISIPEETTPYCGSGHLLEAVVASVCEKLPESTYHKPQVDSASCSLNQSLVENEASYCLSSEVSGVWSSRCFSSPNLSACSGQLERSQETTKVGKKRARPGESGRPRPRDRQLIQDRIKELRDLVPSGSKYRCTSGAYNQAHVFPAECNKAC
ncbi:transcription factor bHLH155-like isoform X2 [Impatiens glandulifera]|uniref:transcription factor bHLH155-like isoform X2 n=1 Tax=Impatiens glandulifera TaxID=253017 RepID=UPI001FB12F4A|nr:transcription factor bHLH155-like isoform X2 [Impatiens glandulifera]